MNDEDDLSGEGSGEDGAASAGAGAEGEGGRSGSGDRPRQSRADRRVEQLLRDRSEKDRQIKALQSRLEMAEAAGNRLASNVIERQIKDAEADLEKGFADGDAAVTAKATRTISELTATKAAAPRQAAPAPAARQETRHTPRTQAWLDANPWFGSDKTLTAAAQLAHDLAERDGLVVDSEEYWDRIHDRVEALAPGTVAVPEGHRRGSVAAGHDEDGDEGAGNPSPAPKPRAPAPGAAPVSRGSGSPAARPGQQIVMSAEMVEMAKIAGVTPQQYAAQAKALMKAGTISSKHLNLKG